MNTAMPWIKLYTEFIDDAKFASCTDSVKLRFVQLMLLAGECDKDGALIAGGAWMPIDAIAWRLRVMADQLASEIAQLAALGVVTRDENGVSVVNFDKRQGRGQAEKREQWRAQKRNQRRVRADSVRTPANVRSTDTDRDTEKEKDRKSASHNNNKSRRTKRAVVVASAATNLISRLGELQIEDPTRTKLAEQLATVDSAALAHAFDRLQGEKMLRDEGHPSVSGIKNWAGYAVSVLRELPGVTR
jgi:hypothetical protein